jgi:polyhydroxyalkanoate synthesis repressor PhaR
MKFVACGKYRTSTLPWITHFALQQKGHLVKPAKVIIKKYENRRLYDTSTSRYVNLEEVAAMIREGADIQVIDAKSGDDVTRVILTQIIMEDARDQQTGLPLELLRQLIVASAQARQDFMMWYLKTAFDTYQKVQDTVQSQLSGMRSAAAAPLETMRRFFTGYAPQQTEHSKDEELAELRERIAELEGRLKKKPAKKRRAARERPS